MLALGLGIGLTLGGGPMDPPTAGFDFTSGSLDPRITFTRASAAYRVNASGILESIGTNLPRFDYNPTTLTARGLLVEESRTNLALRSEALENAAWVRTGLNTVTVDAIVAPNGVTTADKIVENSANSQHGVDQTFAKAASALPYTYSVWLKSGERTKHTIAILDTAGVNGFSAAVDTGAGTIGSATAVGAGWTAGSTRIEAWPNGWYRCILRGTSTVAVDLIAQYRLADSGGAITYVGDNASGAYAWGAQLEQAEFETSYVATAGASATRSADVTAITGGNFSGFYNEPAGTWLFVGTPAPLPSSIVPQHAMSANDGTSNERQHVRRSAATTNGEYRVDDGGVQQVGISLVTFTSLTRFKAAAAYTVNDFAASLNGAAPGTDAVGTIPTPNRLDIGQGITAIQSWNGWIESISYWNTRKSNALLQSYST